MVLTRLPTSPAPRTLTMDEQVGADAVVFGCVAVVYGWCDCQEGMRCELWCCSTQITTPNPHPTRFGEQCHELFDAGRQ